MTGWVCGFQAHKIEEKLVEYRFCTPPPQGFLRRETMQLPDMWNSSTRPRWSLYYKQSHNACACDLDALLTWRHASTKIFFASKSSHSCGNTAAPTRLSLPLSLPACLCTLLLRCRSVSVCLSLSLSASVSTCLSLALFSVCACVHHPSNCTGSANAPSRQNVQLRLLSSLHHTTQHCCKQAFQEYSFRKTPVRVS